jgi:DNA-binding NtrC family response regulator
MTEKSHTILVIDDERNVLNSVKRTLRKLRVEVETADSAPEALVILGNLRGKIAAVIADHNMPGMTGVELLRRVKKVEPNAVRILFTGYADMDVVISAINEGEVFRFMTKPWQDLELQGLVLTAIQHHDVLVENQRLLRKVREHEATLGELEKQSPGLTDLPPRDETGAFIIEAPDGDGADLG